MPELPFIQVLCDNLDRELRERVIRSIRLASPALLKSVDPPLSEADGRRIAGVRRAAKLIVVDLEEGLSLVLHLMRDGRIQIGAPRSRPGKDLALALQLDDGREVRVVEHGPKKRASLYVARTEELADLEPLRDLGLDPLDEAFTPERLEALVRGETVQLKRFLTLPRHITGIGNAYADEILWEARLSPFIPAGKLSLADVHRLHTGIVMTLRRALAEHRAHFAEDLPSREPLALLRVHRHGGEPCPRCGTRVAQVAYAERETYYCPGCQTGGKVYADRRMSRLLK